MKLPRFTTATGIWTASAAAVVALIAWFAWPRSVSVQIVVVDRGEVRREIAEEGRIRVHDIYIVAAPVGGLLKRVLLEPGDTVTKGDAVAAIAPADPSLLDARIAEEAAAVTAAARAGLALAESDLELARIEDARTTQLFDHGYAAKAALDRTRAGLKAATSVVDQRKAELKRALAAEGKPAARARTPTTVRSPASGKVLEILQESETVVAPGTPLLEIGDPGQIEVVAEFLSQDAAIMREGAPASIEKWGGSQPIAAVVHTVEPYAKTKVSALGVEEQRVNVVLHFTRNPPIVTSQLGHGFRADVRVVVFEQKDALRVPTDALIRQSDGGWATFRVVDGRARLAKVTVGDGDDRFRVVTAGLAARDNLVLFPGDTLKDGDTVQVKAK